MKGKKYYYEEGIKVYYYIPSDRGENEELPIVFVFPGKPRNSDSIIADMMEIAEKRRIILLSAKFDFEKYPPDMYNRGNIVIESAMEDKYDIQEDSSKYTFKKFKSIFTDFVQRLGLNNKKCDIYGFSAGAQALWTFLQFGSAEDISFVDKAYLFSAGRYCYPSKDFAFPNGIKEFETLLDEDLERFFGLNIGMGVGLLDNDPEEISLPNAPFDRGFGEDRVTRARNFYNYCKKLAAERNIIFNWEYKEVKDIAHNNVRKPGKKRYGKTFYR